MYESTACAAPAERVDARVRECALETVCETVATVLGAAPRFLGYEAADGCRDGLYGIISLIGDRHSVSFVLAIPTSTAAALAGSFMGFELGLDDPEVTRARALMTFLESKV